MYIFYNFYCAKLTVVAVVSCQLAKAQGLHVKPCLLQVPDAGQAASDAVGLAVASDCCEGFTQRLEACRKAVGAGGAQTPGML
jgi:hypothetical protein